MPRVKAASLPVRTPQGPRGRRKGREDFRNVREVFRNVADAALIAWPRTL